MSISYFRSVYRRLCETRAVEYDNHGSDDAEGGERYRTGGGHVRPWSTRVATSSLGRTDSGSFPECRKRGDGNGVWAR